MGRSLNRLVFVMVCGRLCAIRLGQFGVGFRLARPGWGCIEEYL